MYKTIRQADVKGGRVKSCGCWRRENGRIQIEKLVEKGMPYRFKEGNCINKGNQYWKKRKNHVSGTKGKRRYTDSDGEIYYA